MKHSVPDITTCLPDGAPGHQDGVFERIDFTSDADPTQGIVRWSPLKSLWWSAMVLGWVTLGIAHFSLSALLVFLVLSALTLCLGHSIGMHRKLIHGAFDCPLWLERLLVYLGTLVGLGGPYTMMHTHDMRDWAQRKPACHAFLSHQNPILRDFWWQLHCKLHLAQPPVFQYPDLLGEDRFYRILQASSMAQQLPLGVVLFAIGGWGWVAWGVCGRVAVSVFGHWLVGYFAHNSGQRDWHLTGVSTQGFNLPHLGLLTFGECWHNNHHAFPGSARLGLTGQQFDPGWHVLTGLQKLGLVWNIRTPDNLPERAALQPLNETA